MNVCEVAGYKTNFSSSGIVAVVAGTISAGNRASVVSLLAGEEPSLDFEVSDRAVFSTRVGKSESCEGGSKTEADEGLHYERNPENV
jgi:hypothetical protein